MHLHWVSYCSAYSLILDVSGWINYKTLYPLQWCSECSYPVILVISAIPGIFLACTYAILAGAGYQDCLVYFLISKVFFQVFFFFLLYFFFYSPPPPSVLRKKQSPAVMSKSHERVRGLGCDWSFLVLFTGHLLCHTCWRWVLPYPAQHTFEISRSVSTVYHWP